MKDFRDFDPSHPFHHEETLQIKNRKLRLSYIPLIDSVSVRGYLPVDSPSDVVANTYWVDYRYDDGYRSSNAEVVFDSSANDRYVDIAYFGIGTVLRAEDMREVSDSLDAIQKTNNEQSQNISDLGIKIGVVAEKSQDLLDSHEKNPAAHQSLIDSIQSSRDFFEYRLNSQDTRLNGFINLLDSTAASLQSQIHKVDELSDSQIQEVESRLEERIKSEAEVFDDFRDEFTGLYNMISNLDDKYALDLENNTKNIENLLATERVSFITSINNAKNEMLSRAITEMQAGDDSIRSEIEKISEKSTLDLSEIFSMFESVDVKLDSIAGELPTVYHVIDAEKRDRISFDNDILDSIASLRENIDWSFDNLEGNIGNLADTLYQARQATNNQMESLRANVAIAEENLLSTRRDLEVLMEAKEIVESLQASVTEYVEAQFAPVKAEISESIAAFDSQFGTAMTASIASQRSYMTNYFSKIEESVAAVWDGIDEKIGDIDFSEYEASILANSADIASNSESIASNATSIANNSASIKTNTTKISGHETRIKTLENRQSVYIVGTTARSETGGIWRV